MLSNMAVPPSQCADWRKVLVLVVLLMNTRSLVAVLLFRQPKGGTICAHDLLISGVRWKQAQSFVFVLFEKDDVHHSELHCMLRLVLLSFDGVFTDS